MGSDPSPTGTNPTQLGLSHSIERTDHTNQPRRGQIQVTAGSALVRGQYPTNNHSKDISQESKSSMNEGKICLQNNKNAALDTLTQLTFGPEFQQPRTSDA